MTRFPPEPNGYLHWVMSNLFVSNFGLVKGVCRAVQPTVWRHQSWCWRSGFVDNIKRWCQMARIWLGRRSAMRPVILVNSSDWAVKLIKQGDAYVDFAKSLRIFVKTAAIFGQVEAKTHLIVMPVLRDLQRFDDMKLGKYGNGEAVLRAKNRHGKPQYEYAIDFCIVSYTKRITNRRWLVYLSMYDYAHPVVRCNRRYIRIRFGTLNLKTTVRFMIGW